MKRILAFVLVVLMAASTLWGCQKSNAKDTLTQELTDERADEIKFALYEKEGLLYPWYSEGYGGDHFYLGTANGYDIIYYVRGCAIPDAASLPYDDHPDMVINDLVFEGSCDNEFLAYKDGTFYPLTEIYQNEKIGDAVIPQLHEIYTSCYQKKLETRDYWLKEGFGKFEEDYADILEADS